MISNAIHRQLSKIRAKLEFGVLGRVSPLAKIHSPYKVTFESDIYVAPHAVLRPKGEKGIEFGKDCTVHEYSYLSGNIRIGDSVRIADKASFYSFSHNIKRDEKISNQGINMGEIVVEDDVWVGTQATILQDVRIGEGAVIGAGSVVKDDVGSYTIVAGSPATKIGQR